MNRKIRCITQGGLAAKSLNEALDMNEFTRFAQNLVLAVGLQLQLAHQQLKNLTPSLRQGW
jgi:hypothetical protein